jgi:hypothetical protein
VEGVITHGGEIEITGRAGDEYWMRVKSPEGTHAAFNLGRGTPGFIWAVIERVAELGVARWGTPHPIPVAEPEWYDIASKGLPESGVNVLATYVNRAGKWRVVKAQWVAKSSEIATTEDENSEYDEEKDDYFVPEGWYECIDNWDEYATFAITEGAVTHWRPLPRPPAAAIPLPEASP